MKMMDRRRLIGFSSACYLLLVVSEVKGILTPSGTVSLDCGSQQRFICSANGTSAGWTITGLSGITAAGNNGQFAAANNGRITTTDTSGVTQTSTITITGFTTADNGGTVQCIDLASSSVQGRVTVSIGTPSCPTIIASARNKGFTAANVTWSQPATLPVTSTVVTYCSKSSPNCGNSVNCTSPCIISGLDPCVNYSVTVTPSNNCGSATGCDPMNTVDSLSQGDPETPTNFRVETNNGCSSATAKWEPSALATSTIVSYCRVSSANCKSSMVCSSPCTITGLMLTAGYDFRAVHTNNCGRSLESPVVSTSPIADCVSQLIGGAVGGAIGGCLLLGIIIAVVIVVVCYCCPCARSACCCCVASGSKRSTSTEPMKPRPGEEYADPQKVRENKESGKQGITYAALEFSEQAGSTGGQNVRSKEQPVQYMAVEHA